MTTGRDGERDQTSERRASRRLNIRLPVECTRDEGSSRYVVRTITKNVSAGGTYLEMDSADLQPGDRLRIELTLPPSEGVSPYQGRAACDAEVIRVCPTSDGQNDAVRRFGVATRFLDRLRISY